MLSDEDRASIRAAVPWHEESDNTDEAHVFATVERIRDDAVAAADPTQAHRRAAALGAKIDRCTIHMRKALGYSPDQPDAGLESLCVQAKNRAEAAERALVERVRAACDELERPFAGARQRANNNEDFAEIAAEEKARKNAAARVRAALRPEAATTERHWDECLHGVTLGSVCLDCPSKWASIPARPAATTEGAEPVENGESGDTWAYVVTDGPKMLRETLSVAQSRIWSVDDARNEEHSKRLGRLIDECERHRPTDNACKHGDLHTPTCGCEDCPVHPDTEGAVGVVLRCECGHAQRDHRHDHGRCEERDRGTWCGCEAYRPRPVPDRAARGEGEPT